MLPAFRIDLIGKVVLHAGRDAEGLGLQMSGGWSVAVWAHAQVVDARARVVGLHALVGRRLTGFAGDAASETLTFDNGCELRIRLGANARSTSSMVVDAPDHSTIIWD
jgi:hypothetical protein